METLQEIARRIQNAEDLRSLVRTMKTIAAVNIRHLERSVTALADYHRTAEMGLQIVLRERERPLTPANGKRHAALGVIVFGSDQGMCGQFNEQIAAYALGKLDEMGEQAGERKVLAIGLRTAARLQDAGQPVDRVLEGPRSLAGITPIAQEVLWQIGDWQAGVDSIELFYNRLVSGSAYEPMMAHLWPIDPQRFLYLKEREWPSRVLPTFTMDAEKLISALLRQYLFVSLYRAFSKSMASENASRLASMQAAERNIEQKLAELGMLYHQQRQSGITSELLDIISGYEVLSKH